MRKRGWVGVVALGALGLISVERVEACDYGDNVLTIEETGAGAPPGPLGEVTTTVQRGQGPRSSGCFEQMSTSCDDIGSIALHFAPVADADSPFEAVGYRVRVVEGEPPSSLSLSAEPLVPYRDDAEATLYLRWIDGATDEQEPLAFTIRLTPVDEDGNEGPESEPILIRDGGGDEGCGIGRGSVSDSAIGVLVIAALAFVVRRRSLGDSRANPRGRRVDFV